MTLRIRPLLQRLRPALYIGQAALYSQVASIDFSTLAWNRRFIVDGSVKGTWVQPWTRLFAENNGDPIQVAPDVDAAHDLWNDRRAEIRDS